MNQELAQLMLRKRGHSVTIANNGEEGVEMFINQDYDVILMDVQMAKMQMPKMNGYEATQHIRQIERKTGPMSRLSG